MIDLNNYIENEEKLIEQYEELMPSQISVITYHKELLIILDTFKLLCFYFANEIDYIHINDPEIISLIKETKQRIIEKGCNA